MASLLNGASVTVTIQATLNFGVADGAIVTNIASATSTTPDPDTGNNSGSATITVQNKSDLLVTTQSSLTVVNLGELWFTQ